MFQFLACQFYQVIKTSALAVMAQHALVILVLPSGESVWVSWLLIRSCVYGFLRVSESRTDRQMDIHQTDTCTLSPIHGKCNKILIAWCTVMMMLWCVRWDRLWSILYDRWSASKSVKSSPWWGGKNIQVLWPISASSWQKNCHGCHI